jgi:uncharacterized protein (TIGR02996 family)
MLGRGGAAQIAGHRPKNPHSAFGGMTMEDALLTALLDTPADEGPRVAYAEWLEKQGDPRCDYLRAEANAFRQGDGGSEAIAHIRRSAVGLDPVWVARISRPPVGVCCVTVRFKKNWGASPRLQPVAFARIESWLGTNLPPDYRAFLLNYNGGQPDPGRFTLSSGGLRRVDELLSIWSPEGESVDFDLDLVSFAEDHLVGNPPLRQPGIGIPADCIKIGVCDLTGEGDTLCLAFTGKCPSSTRLWVRRRAKLL